MCLLWEASSFTFVNFSFHLANAAVDLTTPSKSAIAPLGDFNLLCGVASVAAHQIATVDTDRGGIALTTFSAHKTVLGISNAKVWRLFKKDQISAGWRWVAFFICLQWHALLVLVLVSGNAAKIVVHPNTRRLVKTLFQVVANLAKRRQSHPACLHST